MLQPSDETPVPVLAVLGKLIRIGNTVVVEQMFNSRFCPSNKFQQHRAMSDKPTVIQTLLRVNIDALKLTVHQRACKLTGIHGIGFRHLLLLSGGDIGSMYYHTVNSQLFQSIISGETRES